MRSFNLPLTLGPETLMVAALFFYLLGYLTVLPLVDFSLGVCLILSAILVQFIIPKTYFYLPMVALTFFTLGKISCWKKATLPAERLFYFRLSNVKNTSKTVQAYGQEFRKEKHWLIPTGRKVSCTILRPKHRFIAGDVIATYAEIKPVIGDDNPGGFDIVTYYRSKGISYHCFLTNRIQYLGHHPTWWDKIERFRGRLCKIFDYQLSKREAGIAKALLLGESSDVDPSCKAAFSATGAIHVLAVSGMHIALFSQLLLLSFGLFQRFFRKQPIQIICILVVWCYAILTGLSPSVVRSVIMFTLLQIGQILGKESPKNHSLLLCAFIMLAFDPDCLFDIGFQLSFLAVVGIFNFQQPLEKLIKPQHKIYRFIWSNTCIALAAQTLTLPLTLYYFHTFPNYFLLANIGVALLSVAAMYSGFLYLFVCSIPYLGEICAIPFQWSLKTLRIFLEIVASLPGAIAEGYLISFPLCCCFLLAIIWLFNHRIPVVLRILPASFFVIFITLRRYQHQQENHLYLLQGKTPVLVLKRGLSASVFIPNEAIHYRWEMLLYNYRKIFPFNELDTNYLHENDSIVLPEFTLTHMQKSMILSRKNGLVDTLNWSTKRTHWRPKKMQID